MYFEVTADGRPLERRIGYHAAYRGRRVDQDHCDRMSLCRLCGQIFRLKNAGSRNEPLDLLEQSQRFFRITFFACGYGEEARHRGNDSKLTELALTILDWSWEWGWDKEFGGIINFRDCKCARRVCRSVRLPVLQSRAGLYIRDV